nr:ComEC/Rec2 family competence protein [Aureimonas jatrophae]
MGFGIAAFYADQFIVPVSVLLCGLVSAVIAIACYRSRPSIHLMGIVVLGLLAGQGLAHVEVSRTKTTIISGDATTRIVGRVLGRETDDRGRQRYNLRLISTDRPTLSRPPERVRILVSARHTPLAIGSLYHGLVRLRPPAGPAYPGGHDFSFAPYFDGLGAYGFALGVPNSSLTTTLTVSDHLTRLRLSMGERIRDELPGAVGAVASALITGERAGIPQAIEDDLRATSLAHILSISGFHMSLVAGFCMVAVRCLLACFPSVALRWPIRKVAAFAALVATTFYLLLSGDNAATVRSFIMITLMLGAVLIDRPSLTLRNVALAAVIVMVLTPHAVLTATFQMSFAATAALVGAFGAYARWRSGEEAQGARTERSVFQSIYLALAAAALSAIIAGMATAPYGVYQFQRVAPFGLVANLVATPIFSFWVMPLALVSALAMPFGLERIPLTGMGYGLELSFVLARHLATWLPDQATGRISTASLLLFTLAILALSFCASRLRWSCIPLALAAVMYLPPKAEPEAVLFEDGRQLALLMPSGILQTPSNRPNRFVTEQWLRVFSLVPGRNTSPSFLCSGGICRAETRSGVRISWTDDWRNWPAVCEDADVAIVARAIRSTECPDGGLLVTLRSLRLSGSLAISKNSAGVTIEPSVDPDRQPWNAHRREPWPEFWRRSDATTARTITLSDTVGSSQRDALEP